MSVNLLLGKMEQIQQQYKALLISIKGKYEKSIETILIADEVQIFWYKYRNIIKLYLSHLPKDSSTLVFTGAGYLNIAGHEHYPLLTLGKRHIIDDSLSRYMQNTYQEQDTLFDNELKKQTERAIDDNINILENFSQEFIILPVRLFLPEQTRELHRVCEKLFLSLFNTTMESLDDYFLTYESVEAVFDDINQNIKPDIIFSEEDSKDESIENKYKRYVASNSEMCKGKKETVIFFMATYGHIAQAVDVLLISLEYNMIPYIRYAVCYQYLLLLSPTFTQELNCLDKEKFENKLKIMVSVHVFYCCFNMEKVETINFDDYISCVRALNIGENFRAEVEKKILLPKKPKGYINEVAEAQLSTLYKAIENI